MFEGIHTALITPFRSGQVDEEALRAHVERQIEAGVAGLVHAHAAIGRYLDTAVMSAARADYRSTLDLYA